MATKKVRKPAKRGKPGNDMGLKDALMFAKKPGRNDDAGKGKQEGIISKMAKGSKKTKPTKRPRNKGRS